MRSLKYLKKDAAFQSELAVWCLYNMAMIINLFGNLIQLVTTMLYLLNVFCI